MNLSKLKPGQMAIVDRIVNDRHGEAIAQRLEAMGIVSDRPVQVLREAKFGGPLQIRVGATTEIAIRPQEAEMILVKTHDLSKDFETIPDTAPDLSNQVKTASIVSISAVILVAIAGFYRILISQNINPVAADEKVLVGNVAENSQAKLALEEQTKIEPNVPKNTDAVNQKSGSQEPTSRPTNRPEITPPTTNQNSNISTEEKTSFKPQNLESKAQKITDKNQLAELEQKLYNTIDQTWQTPLNQTSIYLVKVDKNGAIDSYQPFNQVAADNLNNTPLPTLVNSEATGKTESPETDWAEFAILLYDNGTLEVQAK